MKPLRILMYCFANEATGLGHWFRSLALAQAAHQRGHTVTIASNRTPPRPLKHIQARYLDPGDYNRAIQASRPDWVVVDLPHTPPAWIREMTPGKIAFLNGIGYNQADGLIDLRIIQGAAEVNLPGEQDKVPTVKGLEYIILRPEIAQHKGAVRGEFSLIWGGAADGLSLLQNYADWFPDEKAFFLVADMTPIPLLKSPNHWLLKLKEDSDDLFWWLARCKRLVCTMGMIIPESIYLSTPSFCLNYSPLHLAFSTPLAERGLIKNYPAVGLPSREEMERFLTEPWERADSEEIGIEGALRVVKEIEGRS